MELFFCREGLALLVFWQRRVVERSRRADRSIDRQALGPREHVTPPSLLDGSACCARIAVAAHRLPKVTAEEYQSD